MQLFHTQRCFISRQAPHTLMTGTMWVLSLNLSRTSDLDRNTENLDVPGPSGHNLSPEIQLALPSVVAWIRFYIKVIKVHISALKKQRDILFLTTHNC